MTSKAVSLVVVEGRMLDGQVHGVMYLRVEGWERSGWYQNLRWVRIWRELATIIYRHGRG